MSKVLQVVAFGLVSALSPALLFAEGKSATCDSGMYAGFEVFLNAAKNKVKAADKDADAAKKRELADKLDELIDGSQAVDLEGLIDSVVGGEDSTFAQALSKATTKDGVSIALSTDGKQVFVFNAVTSADDGRTRTFVKASKESVASAVSAFISENGEKVKGITAVNFVLNQGAEAIASGDGLSLADLKAGTRQGVQAVVSGGSIGGLSSLLGQDPSKFVGHVNPHYYGGAVSVGYQHAFGNGFSGAVELLGGWSFGSSRWASFGTDATSVFTFKGGYKLGGYIIGRYALAPQVSVGLGAGVTLKQQRLNVLGDDKENNRLNIRTTHPTILLELAVSPQQMSNLRIYTRMYYDFQGKKNNPKFRDSTKDKKDGAASGLNISTQGATFALGMHYVF